MTRTALILLSAAFVVAAPLAASAAGEPGRLRGRVIRTLSEPAVTLACNRAAVRDCQADASLFAQVCEARPDRLACVDRTLHELQMCWSATGCF